VIILDRDLQVCCYKFMLLVRGILPPIKITIVGLIVLFASGRLWGADESDQMTVEKFREITSRPGDNVPLQSELAKVPWWTNTVANMVTTNFAGDDSGKVSKTVSRGKARTVKGKYIVFYSDPESDRPARKSMLTYDERSSTYKTYGTFGTAPGYESLTEGTMVYDFTKKTYSETNTIEGSWKVISHGSYSTTQISATSCMYQDNHLLTITVGETQAVSPGAAEPQR